MCVCVWGGGGGGRWVGGCMSDLNKNSLTIK